MTQTKTLSLLIAGFLFIAAACIATPPPTPSAGPCSGYRVRRRMASLVTATASEVRMTKTQTLSLLIAGFLFVAAACIATPPTHALGWSLIGVQSAAADDLKDP